MKIRAKIKYTDNMKMERLYKFTYSLLVMALITIPFNSCIKDDMADCPTNIRVYFDYLPLTYAAVIKQGIDTTKITQMNLYWFDAKTNLFLGEKIDMAPNFGSDYYIDIPMLPAGEYKFIAWGNLKDSYALVPEVPVIGSTTFDQFAAHLTVVEDNLVRTTITPLFYGQKANKEIKTGELSQEVRIPIVQDTYTINLKVHGTLNQNSRYLFAISDNNTYFDFDNSYIPSQRINFIADVGSPTDGLISGLITILRIDKGPSSVLSVVDRNNTSDPIFSADILELLKKLETEHKIEIDFANMYEFDIDVEINGSSFVVVINGWELVYDEHELHG